MRRRTFLLWTAGLALSSPLSAADGGIPKPGPRDLCPVCGMLVAKYPNWVATVEGRKGRALFFDGPKDFFKYLFDVPKYSPGHRAEDISRMLVTEFYGLTRIDARKALFVIGSDVLGPMGHELIPLASRADAEEFLTDHKGQRILSFDEVSRDLVWKLDSGGGGRP